MYTNEEIANAVITTMTQLALTAIGAGLGFFAGKSVAEAISEHTIGVVYRN